MGFLEPHGHLGDVQLQVGIIGALEPRGTEGVSLQLACPGIQRMGATPPLFRRQCDSSNGDRLPLLGIGLRMGHRELSRG